MTQVSNSLENKEGTTLTEEVKYRDLVRRAGSLNKTLGEIRFDVRKKGIQLHELLKGGRDLKIYLNFMQIIDESL